MRGSGTQLPLEETLFDGVEPDCPVRWPLTGKLDMVSIVPTDEQIQEFVGRDWADMLAVCTLADPAGLMHRLGPEWDQVPNRERTMYWELPIMIDVGTTSYADTRIRCQFVEDHVDARYIIKVGDMQTFQRDWWFNFKFPAAFPNQVTFAGEFHARYHVQHADKRLNESLVYLPLFMHFGIKGLTGPKLEMKKQAMMEQWQLLFLSGTVMWLRRVFVNDLGRLEDIPALLGHVKKNFPVLNHIGWAYYHCNFIWGDKKATRVGDTRRLNFMWQYSLLMYGLTNKNTYKKGCLQNWLLLEDCEDNVKEVVDKRRTYTETGRPCSGGDMDHLRERVSLICLGNDNCLIF